MLAKGWNRNNRCIIWRTFLEFWHTAHFCACKHHFKLCTQILHGYLWFYLVWKINQVWFTIYTQAKMHTSKSFCMRLPVTAQHRQRRYACSSVYCEPGFRASGSSHSRLQSTIYNLPCIFQLDDFIARACSNFLLHCTSVFHTAGFDLL